MDDYKFEANPTFGEIEEIEDEVEKRFRGFKNFDVISNPPFDHRFIYKKIVYKLFDTSLTKKMKKEWEILEASLPASIYVRVYETRVDLMRAVIVGPEGTPYSHALFFFDLFFPSSYPSRPPEVLYHSYGFDVNPNLHRNGKVSLNLLNHWYQWYGRKEHKWNPKQSTILQVLVLIQSQVLNAKPYLNQPIPLLKFSEDQCLKYNKDVFILTREAMLYDLKTPPRNFEDLVAGHFRHTAHPVLMNCKAFVNTSKSMHQLFIKLLKAFEANGAYCRHHYNRALKEEELGLKQERPPEQKYDNRFAVKTLNKLKLLDLLN